jgi:hypothetical protein
MTSCEVLEEARNVLGTVSEQSDRAVAAYAEQSSDASTAGLISRAARVIMINCQPRSVRVQLTAHGAETVLTSQQGIVNVSGKAVVRHEPPVEPAFFNIRFLIAHLMVTASALTCFIRSALTARASHPHVFGPGTTFWPHGNTRAQQRTTDEGALYAKLFSYCSLSQTIVGIKPGDACFLLWREFSFSSHVVSYITHSTVWGE